MFQEKEIEAYQEIKAPAELKNRVWTSVKQHRKKVRKQQMTVVAAAACFAFILSISGVMDSNSVLSVNDTRVSYRAVDLNQSARSGLLTASEGVNSDSQIQIPLEIQVEKAHICVSQGILQQMEADSTSHAITEMDITESTVIYWVVNGDTDSIPTCTITTDDEEYTYVLDFDEEKSVFTLKQEK